MTIRKLYGASFGPYEYDDTDTIDDVDSEWTGLLEHASISDGGHLCGFLDLFDTNESNHLKIYWNENDTSNRTLAILVVGGNRSLTFNENFTIADGFDVSIQALGQANAIVLNENFTIADGYNVTIQALGQANQLTLNEGFTIGDGSAGTLTFSAGSKVLTVEDNTQVNQDLTTDADVVHNQVTLQNVIFPDVLVDQVEPTGFENRTDSTLAFNDGTRVFTIDDAAGSFSYYRKGIKVTKTTAQNTTVPDTTQLNYIYFDSNDVLQNSTNWTFGAGNVWVATVYYDTGIGNVGRVGDERHGAPMDWETHKAFHEGIGPFYESGFALSFADATHTISAGGFHDENIEHTIAQQTTSLIVYRQSVGSPSTWTWDAANAKYYKEDGGSDILYDNAGTPTALAGNKYMAMWIFVSNDPDAPTWSLMGQRTDNTISDARENNTFEDLDLTGLPSLEMLLLARVILRNDATPFVEIRDYRGSLLTGRSTVLSGASNVAASITTDTTNFNGNLSVADTDVQAALDTLDDMTVTAGAHAANHTDGTDDIQDATAGQKGVATTAQITKLDGIEALADVTGSNTPQAHAAGHKVAGGDDLLGAPGAIGGGTPAPGAFTTLSASGLISANGGQIAFPVSQNASADVNTLDDYEEGSWTPVLEFGGASVDITYSIQAGEYTKVGRIVVVSAFIILTSKGTSIGDATITGLPFAIAAGLGFYPPALLRVASINFADFIQAFAPQTLSHIVIAESTNAGLYSTITNGNFANNSQFMLCLNYQV